MNVLLRNIVCSLVVLGGLAACASAPTQIKLDPDVRFQTTTLGQGRVVNVNVTNAIAPRQLAENQSQFALEQPASVAVNNALIEGLQHHGFSPQNGAASSYQVNAEIIKADNVITKDTFTDNILIDISVQITVITPAGTRTKAFNNSIDRKVSSAKIGDVAGELNQLMAQILNRAVNDGELLGFLSQ